MSCACNHCNTTEAQMTSHYSDRAASVAGIARDVGSQRGFGLIPEIRQYDVKHEISEQTVRESHVPNEVIGLRVTVDALVAEIDALCARLANVTSPLPAQAKGDGSPGSYRVPLADEIRCERRRVQGVVDLVRRLSTHLEL